MKINNNEQTNSYTDLLEGTIPEPVKIEILKRLTQRNILFKYGKLVPSVGRHARIKIREAGEFNVGTYDETERINAVKHTSKIIDLVSKKYATIESYTNEAISWTDQDFVEFFTKMAVDYLNAKINSELYPELVKVAIKNGQSVEADNIYDIEVVGQAIQTLVDNFDEEDLVAIFSRKEMVNVKTIVNKVSHTKEYDEQTNTILGVPVDFFSKLNIGKAFIIAQDSLAYILPEDFRVKVTEDATLSTVKNSDGSDVHLFEQDMVAIRFVCQLGWVVRDELGVATLSKKEVAPEGKTAKK